MRFVQLFTGRLKTFFEEGLGRGMQYLPMIQSVFRAEGLPLDLAYVPLVESAFKPTAMSRAKARGIWQFLRGTGLANGLTHDWYVDERVEPEKATLAAAKYLKTLHTMFNGNWPLALASYNAGPGRVQRAIQRSGRTDFWKLAASTRHLPRETRDYVPAIMAAIIIARDPAQYGMNVRPIETPRFETVTLSAAVDLRRIAGWIGTPAQAIQGLNPELRRWTTPIRATDYELKVPDGTGDIVRAHLAQADPDELAPLDWHTVKKGETLVSVARNLRVRRTDLAEANYLSTRARLLIGQRLIIPRAPTLLLASRPRQPAARYRAPAGQCCDDGEQYRARCRAHTAGFADSPREAGRHALRACQVVPDDRRFAQDLEPPAEQHHPGGTAPHHLYRARHDRNELGQAGGLPRDWRRCGRAAA